MSDDARKPSTRLLARVTFVLARENDNPNLREVMDQCAAPFEVSAASHDDLRIAAMFKIDEALKSLGVPGPDEIKVYRDPV